MNLPEADKRKITGILGMLASAHDGERASAALLLTRMLAKHGARPEELLNGKANGSGNGYAVGVAREIATLRANLLSANNHVRDLILERASLRQEITALKHRQREAAAPPPPPPHSRDRTGREEITELLDRQDIRWTDWEREFLESVARWRGPLTSRQEESLKKIRAKAAQQDAARKAAAGIWG